LEGRAIAKPLYKDYFLEVEVCKIKEPLVKFISLVDGNKPKMRYLYEDTSGDKEARHSYCEDKGDKGYII
jgi:hypothetical protein